MKQTLLLSILLVIFSDAFTQPNQWTWVSGDIRPGQTGLYGLKGVPEFGNIPGARRNAVSWSDASGNFWLFGGAGNALNRTGYLNDLWKYNPATNLWAWMSGDPITDQSGVSGTKGVAAADNRPGGRSESTAWTDASGNLWLFGGQGYTASGSGQLNDLWKYSISTNQWTWMSGDITHGQPGVYGVKGLADAANKPGARSGAVGAPDAAGNLWLFGGSILGAASTRVLNDLWKYTPSTGQWTWISGDNTVNQPNVYGGRSIAGPANKPGGRSGAAVWSTSSGDLWLFGGTGIYGSNPSGTGSINDLWKYSTSTGWWTWMGGDTTSYTSGVYGTKGVAATDNRPGSRNNTVALTEVSGKLLLYGGQGQGSSLSGSAYGSFNDLWEYSPSSGQWTWISGDSLNNVYGFYGSKGIAGPLNKSGGRTGHVGWLDPSGNLWIFGGTSLGASFSMLGIWNDMWRYTLSGTSVTGMSGLSAQKESQAVTLSWHSPDQNIRSFVVERYNGTITGYQSIGSVPAAASSRYSFTDHAPLPGAGFYRIRQVDHTGSTAYSSIAQVDMTQYDTQFGVYQNPVRNVLQVVTQLPAKQKLVLQVRNMNGHVLIRQEQTGYPGRVSFPVPVERLSKGTYLIQVQSENINSTKTFIKQ